MVRRFAAGCIAAAWAGLGAQAQPLDSLFRSVDSPAPDIAASQAPELRGLSAPAIRTRIVRIDLEALAEARRGLLLPNRDPGTLTLFDDTEFDVVFEKSVPAVSGYALQGRLLGVESGTVTFVVRGQTVTGTVTTPSARYTIRPGADGTHVITEVDWAVAPEGEPVPPEDSPDDVFEDPSETTSTRRARRPDAAAPTAASDALPVSAMRTLPTVNSNAWQPQGPGAAGRNGGLFDGQVDNVEPNNAVIGAIHTVLAHPTDADILYIGATNGGVWKTSNATATNPDWTPLIDDMGAMSIGAMAFDRNDPEVVLVGFGRYSSFGRRGGDRNGLLLSTDGGATWTKLDDPLLIDMNVSGLSIDGDRLVVSGNGYTVAEAHRGVVRSMDGGATWTAVAEADGLPARGAVLDMVDDPSDPDRFYASVQYSGIFRSDDGGTTWSHASANDAAIQAVMTNRFNNNAEMAVAHDGRLYLAAMIGGQARYIGHTDDQGGTWTAMDLPQTPESDGDIEGLNPRFKAGAQGYIHFSIRVDPQDADVVYVGGDRQDEPFPNYIGARDYTGRLFRGNAAVEATGEVPSPQWEHLTHSAFIAGIPGGGTANNSAPHADSREMVFDTGGDLIQVDDGGIYRRTSPGDNTGDWFSLNGNLQVTEMHDVAYDTLANVIVSGNQDVGNSHQTAGGSLYWDTVTGGDGGDVVIDVRESEGRSIRYLSYQYLLQFNGHIYDANNERIGFLAPGMLVNGSIRLSEWEANLQFVPAFRVERCEPEPGGARRILALRKPRSVRDLRGSVDSGFRPGPLRLRTSHRLRVRRRSRSTVRRPRCRAGPSDRRQGSTPFRTGFRANRLRRRQRQGHPHQRGCLRNRLRHRRRQRVVVRRQRRDLGGHHRQPPRRSGQVSGSSKARVHPRWRDIRKSRHRRGRPRRRAGDGGNRPGRVVRPRARSSGRPRCSISTTIPTIACSSRERWVAARGSSCPPRPWSRSASWTRTWKSTTNRRWTFRASSTAPTRR